RCARTRRHLGGAPGARCRHRQHDSRLADPLTPALRRDEGGFTTLQYVVATGFSLVLFVLVANLLVDLYARGAVRDALDEGVRAQVPGAAPADACEARARGV